jgi:hypothetical protein
MKEVDSLWESLKRKNLKGLKARIRSLFQENDHQDQVLLELYRLVIPQWDKVETIRGSLEIGDQGWVFICGLFIKFDREHHRDCLPGGAWVNRGFSVNPRLSPYDLSYANCIITYQA